MHSGFMIIMKYLALSKQQFFQQGNTNYVQLIMHQEVFPAPA